MKMAMPSGEQAGFADGIAATSLGTSTRRRAGSARVMTGVHVFADDGVRIGLILLPEMCANVCFGRPEAQPSSWQPAIPFYALYVDTKGAHFA